MPETEIRHDPFHCPKIGTLVIIDWKILIHRVNGVIDKDGPLSFHCSHAAKCGVGITSGLGITFDWTKCVHPDKKWQSYGS
jgi:hypothetical protein